MTPRSFLLDQRVFDYLLDHGGAPDPVMAALTAETEALGRISVMQSAPEQLRLMTLLTRALGVRNAIEVGTFTGSSALAVARGLPADGRIICLDISEEWTSIGRRYWEQAGVADRIDLRLGPAADSLRALPADAVFDLAYIDADKESYPVYFDEVVRRMRPGGVILIDNTLQSGRIVDPDHSDPLVRIVREFNDQVMRDDRVDSVLLPLADGVTFAVKKP